MVDLEKLKSEFRDGKYQEKDYCFDEEGIEIAVKRALLDFTDRTEKLKPDSGYKSFGVEEKFKVLCGTDGKEYNVPKGGSFVQKFIDYFFKDPVEFKSQKDFDDWHKEMCEEFLAVIGPKYQDGLKYGKAQKIVNMTFKNAYCLKNKVNSKFTNCDKYYEYCHMPLDSIILEWVKRTQAWLCSKDAENNDCKKKKAETLCSTRIPSWSKMNYEECPGFLTSDGKPYYGYKDIQNAIFEYFNKYVEKNTATKYLKGCTPLQAEFFVWKYMQLELAAEGIYKQLSSFDVYDEKTKEQIAQNVQTEPGANEEDKKPFNERSINEKLEYLQKMFKDIKKYKLQE